MQPQEAFKLGFLARCIEEGLSSEQTQQLAKQAADCFEKQAIEKAGVNLFGIPIPSFNPIKATADTTKSIADATKSVADVAKGTWPLWLAALSAPPAAGATAAYLANTALDSDEDAVVDEVKQTELAESYNRMAEQLRRQKQLREYKQKRKQTGRVYL